MSLIKVPLVPQWNITDGCVCTPDGGFLYVGSRSINYISSITKDTETPLMRVFHVRQSVHSVDIDPFWGKINSSVGNEKGEKMTVARMFAAVNQDNSIQVWDFDKGCAIQGHKAHCAGVRLEGTGPLPQHSSKVLMNYMNNRNILSVDNQDVVVYCVASNTYCRRPMFVSVRNQQLTIMKCSPFNEHQFAIGTSRGLVLICDLQQMSAIYTLRGHDAAITSLSWNRINISAQTTEQLLSEQSSDIPEPVVAKVPKLDRSETIDVDDIFDIYDYNYLENEFGAPTEGMRESVSTSDCVAGEREGSSIATENFNFAEECQNLKDDINARRGDELQVATENIVTLDECKEAARTQHYLSSSGDEDQSKASIYSLEMFKQSSSDESLDVDGVDDKLKKAVLHQVEVHAVQIDEQKSETIETIEEDSNEEKKKNDIQAPPNRQQQPNKNLDSSSMSPDVLLASISIDGSLWVWNVKFGSSCDYRKLRGYQMGKNGQLCVSWMNENNLIASNRTGNLQFWELCCAADDMECERRNYKLNEIKRNIGYNSVVAFSVCQKEQLLWCISCQREISMENYSTAEYLLKLGCVSTNIGVMRECPDDMNKIALGLSDRRLGIIDISKMAPNNLHIENFSQRVESTVLALAWSPDSKRIAYGTLEGRIGIVNIEFPRRPTFTFNPICGKPIYSICWPDKYLYVVCNGRIAVYEDETNKDAFVIPEIMGVSALSVYQRYLFVGTQKGQLHLYTLRKEAVTGPNFTYEVLQRLELAPRYITDLQWSPVTTNYKLAVVANASPVHIFDFNETEGKLCITHKIDIKSSKAANACVKWSNRNENLLMTCGFDGSVRVWDLSKQDDKECFVKNYHCPMTCGLFLPTNEQILLCAGKSTSLEMIDMRTEKSEDGFNKRPHSRPLDNVQWATKAMTTTTSTTLKAKEKKRNRSAAIEVLAEQENVNGENVRDIQRENVVIDDKLVNVNSEQLSNMLEKIKFETATPTLSNISPFMKVPCTLLYLTTKELNKDALAIMHQLLTTQGCCKSKQTLENPNKSLCAKLYGSKEDARKLLSIELKNHQSSETNGIASLFMPHLTANLKEEILKCVQNKQLTEWHVSQAPSISYNFWQKCCQAFAAQLLDQGYALQAASYMLAIHQLNEAIQMLMGKNYYKEALLVARIHLQTDDPLNKTISEQWINHLFEHGNLTGAALLCVLCNQNNRAYECLSKIRNITPEMKQVIELLKTPNDN